MQQTPGKVKNAIYSRTVFANGKTHVGPTLSTRTVGEWRAALKTLHSLLFSAHRLVHVCWCTLGVPSEYSRRDQLQLLAILQSQLGIATYPLRRNDYPNNSVNIFSCNCPGAITGFSCRAPEKNSPKNSLLYGPLSCKSPPCNSPRGYYRIFL